MPVLRQRMINNFVGGGADKSAVEIILPELVGPGSESKGVVLVAGQVVLSSCSAAGVPDANKLCYGVYLASESSLNQYGVGLVGTTRDSFFNVTFNRATELVFVRPTPIVQGVHLYLIGFFGTGSYPGVVTVTLYYDVVNLPKGKVFQSVYDMPWTDVGFLGLS